MLIALKILVNKLIVVAHYLWIGIRAVAVALLEAARAIWAAIQWMWLHIIQPAFIAIREWIADAARFLKDVFGPLLEIVRDVISWVDLIYNKVLRPILSAMEIVSLILRGLGLLGVDWAKRADAWLYKLRVEIWRAFETVRRYLTDVRSILTLLLDPRGFIARAPFLWSVYAYGRSVWGVLVNFGVLGQRVAVGGVPARRAPLREALARLEHREIFARPDLDEATLRLRARLEER